MSSYLFGGEAGLPMTGANLARAEMQEALAFLAEGVRALRLAGEPEFGTPSGIYGLESLPLELDLD